MERYDMDTVFDVFTVSPYTFLEITRGGVHGNTIASTSDAMGVFKLRDGMVSTNNQESHQSDATLHIRSSESFVANGLISNGIRHDGQDYEIVGSTGGDNFDTGVREHYRLTLQRADFSDYEVV